MWSQIVQRYRVTGLLAVRVTASVGQIGGRKAGAQHPARLGPLVGVGELAKKIQLTAGALHHAAELVHVFALETDDLEGFAHLRLIAKDVEDLLQGHLNALQRVGIVFLEDHPVHERQDGLFTHGEEQLCLVAKVPVDGPAGHPRLGGNSLQGRAPNAPCQEHPAGGRDDMTAGDLCFFLGPANHSTLR